MGVGLALILAACGRDDFDNDPRPPVPAEITVKIGDGQIVVSPKEFGAGLVNFEIANLDDSPATLFIEGPIEAESPEIPARGNNSLKTELETGSYEASADGVEARPFSFEVGPERESGQNDLLLP
ncbi:MAG: hypothetical protein ACRDK5_02535 [Solirubrobacterales bacterium]